MADPTVRQRTVDEVSKALDRVGFAVQGTFESPVHGKKAGNVEYFVFAVLASGEEHADTAIPPAG